MSRTLLLVSLIAVLIPRPAAGGDGPLYAWYDAKGHLVVSDRPLNEPTRVFKVAGSSGALATKPVARTAAAGQFDDLIRKYSEAYSLTPDLVRAVIQVESGFDPRARSPKGAMGLMQLMPQTARDLGVQNPWDPEDNIRGGTKYLRQLLNKYDGRVELALAAYNAGPGAVDRYGEKIPPYRETRDYVNKVSARAGSAATAPPPPEAAPPKSNRVLYRYVVIKDDRAILTYSSTPPASGTYEALYR